MAQLERFHLIAIGVASIILVVVLVLIGILLIKGNNTSSFPPLANSCPDFWYQTNEGCVLPQVKTMKNYTDPKSSTVASAPGAIRNTKDSTITYAIDFTNPAWASYQGVTDPVCGQKKWATAAEVYWDGVTNYNKCPN